MKPVLKNYIVMFTLSICLVIGAYLSYHYYYYSAFENKYWFFCVVLIVLVFTSKLGFQSIKTSQILALLPIIVLYFLSWSIIPHFLRLGIFLFSTLCFLYTGAIIINSKSTIIKFLFFIAFVLSSLNITTLLFYISERSFITRPLINSIFISNSQEMKEYLFGKFSIYHFSIILIFLCSALIFFYKREKENRKISFQIFLLFIISFSLSTFSGPLGAFASEYILYRQNKALLKNMVEARKKGLLENSFSIIKNNGAEKIMVIIGESLTRDYMSLYGYEKDTNPRLIQLSTDTTKGRLIVFDNVITPEVHTVPSLRKVLTNINNRNDIPFEKSVTILDIFEKAGYETFWLSNQTPLGTHDTPTSVIASSANTVYFTANEDSIKNKKISLGSYYDDYLLDVFNNYLERSEPNVKQLYFVHLLGSHWDYGDRYPKDFDKFKTDSDHKNRYLNSILYNDWVIANFIKLAQENQVDIIYYFSDHGEDLDNGHNQENYQPSMARIPFIVYLSDRYLRKNPDLYRKLSAKKESPGMTDNFFQDIQEISGIKSSLFDPKESFVNDQYIHHKRKVVNNRFSYDQ